MRQVGIGVCATSVVVAAAVVGGFSSSPTTEESETKGSVREAVDEGLGSEFRPALEAGSYSTVVDSVGDVRVEEWGSGFVPWSATDIVRADLVVEEKGLRVAIEAADGVPSARKKEDETPEWLRYVIGVWREGDYAQEVRVVYVVGLGWRAEVTALTQGNNIKGLRPKINGSRIGVLVPWESSAARFSQEAFEWAVRAEHCVGYISKGCRGGFARDFAPEGAESGDDRVSEWRP